MNILSTIFETSETAKQEQFRTHYYKATMKQGIAAIEKYVDASTHLSLLSATIEFGELTIQSTRPKGLLTITLTATASRELACDIHIDVASPFGNGKKEITKIYAMLQHEFELAGIGLNH